MTTELPVHQLVPFLHSAVWAQLVRPVCVRTCGITCSSSVGYRRSVTFPSSTLQGSVMAECQRWGLKDAWKAGSLFY